MNMIGTQAAGLNKLFEGLTHPPVEHDAEIRSNQHIIATLRAIRPLMNKLGDALDRHDEPELNLEQCRDIAIALRHSLIAHKRISPDSANIDEAEDFAKGIVMNLNGEIAAQENFEAHPGKCPCDSCVADRSDDHYDRKRDGVAA